VERRQRHRQHDGRAVRVGHDEAFAEVARGRLRVEQREVLVVDFGDEQRHVLVHPQRRGVADDGVAGARESLLGLARHAARKT
jgi:hypothetical protein